MKTLHNQEEFIKINLIAWCYTEQFQNTLHCRTANFISQFSLIIM